MYINNLTAINETFVEYTSVYTGTDAILNALVTASSISAYNAAAIGTWVTVTSADYFSVINNVAGTTTSGMLARELSSTYNNAFSPGYATVTNTTYSSAAGGTYFIAFAARPAAANATVWPLYSYTWEGTYYSILSAQGNGNNTTTNTYWVNKKPTTNLSATGYVGVGMNVNSSWYNNTSDPDFIAAYSSPSNQHIVTPPGSAYWTGPWTSYAAAYPYFQIVGTTTKQW